MPLTSVSSSEAGNMSVTPALVMPPTGLSLFTSRVR